ncbi:Uncharacterized protein GBIM_07798 [Gryllus bimaculatus]|nr:Uncharacterized protein GBIM_07798 [Gryllus bimaculatus]
MLSGLCARVLSVLCARVRACRVLCCSCEPAKRDAERERRLRGWMPNCCCVLSVLCAVCCMLSVLCAERVVCCVLCAERVMCRVLSVPCAGLQREALQRDAERERRLRLDAELRLRDCSAEAERCRGRLSSLQREVHRYHDGFFVERGPAFGSSAEEPNGLLRGALRLGGAPATPPRRIRSQAVVS